MFPERQESNHDEQRSGRPMMTRTCEMAHVADILKEDRRCSCRLTAERMGIPKTIVQQILREDLQKWKLRAVCAACIDSRTERTAP